MRLDNLATTIQDLREMAEKDPSTPITNAIAYLDIFLEKLCTKELPPSYLSAGTLHHSIVCPLSEWESYSDEITAKIRSAFEVKIDELLANYEEAYELEPVTVAEVEKYIEFPYLSCLPPDKDGQAEFMGYKIYKKKVR